MNNFLLYVRTVRYLRVKQILFRLWRYRIKFIWAVKIDLSLREPSQKLCLPIEKANSFVSSTEFVFLNVKEKIPENGEWLEIGDGPLWRYNFHYFDFLTHDFTRPVSDFKKAFINQWLASQPSGSPISWDAYPTSLRIVNWIKYHLIIEPMTASMLQSLLQQAHWLDRNIEWHLGGNHLFSNAKALVFAGCFFEGLTPKRWLDRGIKILSKELEEQILDDGAHFELSVMYHAICLEDVLDLISLFDCFKLPETEKLRSNLITRAKSMLGWLRVMSHPDGEISYFNDGCLGIAPKLRDLEAYASRLSIKIRQHAKSPLIILRHSGYYRSDVGAFSLIADLASVGASYIPGHGHADALSFELCCFGQRLIVNGGISTYNPGALREKERGTKMHSTVCVCDQDSSEMWSVFRVARRATVFDAMALRSGEFVKISGKHDGYQRISHGLVHSRDWRCSSEKIEISDHVNRLQIKAVSRFILHPDIKCKRVSEDKILLFLPGGQRVSIEAPMIILGTSSYALGFNNRVKTSELIVQLIDGKALTEISIDGV